MRSLTSHVLCDTPSKSVIVWLVGEDGEVMVVVRFRVPVGEADLFQGQAEAAVAVLAGRAGFRTADLGPNVDDPELWALVTRWDDVGSYRRALGGYDAKLTVVPLLSRAIDEPTAYV